VKSNGQFRAETSIDMAALFSMRKSAVLTRNSSCVFHVD